MRNIKKIVFMIIILLFLVGCEESALPVNDNQDTPPVELPEEEPGDTPSAPPDTPPQDIPDTDNTDPGQNTGSILEDKPSECARVGGTWKEFSNACADTCPVARSDKEMMCAQAFTNSCDCPAGQCWTQKTCEDI